MRSFGSLFSGIGGIDLGLERAGWDCAWQSEIDPYASKVLAKHWPGVPNLGDITTIDWSTVERPDLVCGGFPCQPVSINGRREAQADARWLWPEYARCLRDLRPSYVIVENVPGLLTVGFDDVAADLAALGYDFQWSVVPACALGASHTRERLFILGHAESFGVEGCRPDRLEVPSDVDQAGVLVGAGAAGRWGEWPAEPDVGRVAHGVPKRVDRLRCLGNAVVPQVAEWIGRRLVGDENGGKNDG